MHPAIPITAIAALAAIEITALICQRDGAILSLVVTLIAGIAGFTLNALVDTSTLANALRSRLHITERKDEFPL